jgi:hypothetical protein
MTTKRWRKIKIRNTLLAKQKQTVNIFTNADPKAASRARGKPLSQTNAPIVKTIYQQIPLFSPLPGHPQPVGTKSDIADKADKETIEKLTNDLRTKTTLLNHAQETIKHNQSRNPFQSPNSEVNFAKGKRLFGDDASTEEMSGRRVNVPDGSGGTKSFFSFLNERG